MDSTEYAAEVAAKVEKAIADAGESVASIALKTGIPRSTLQRRFNSHGTSPFSVRELRDIAVATGTSASELATVYSVSAAAA